jgi:hypothetical protein
MTAPMERKRRTAPTGATRRPTQSQPSSGRRLLAAMLAEGGLDYTLLDARRWLSALTEALLLGAVAHHAGVKYRAGFSGLWVSRACLSS